MIGFVAKPAARRVLWALLFALNSAVIALAGWLEPATAGFGTHRQLGLPPCGFKELMGVPCAGCGLTTAFAHLVRLDIAAAARANVFGIPLFIVTVFTVPLSLAGAIFNLPIGVTLRRLQADWIAVLLGVAAAAVWIVRLVG